MRLYKFKSLAHCRGVEDVIKIIEKNEYWCSRFFDLNDPMEGVFRDLKSNDTLFTEKEGNFICSFSCVDDKQNPLKDPLMWGYYANGFRGVAIELDSPPAGVKQINYTDQLVVAPQCRSIDKSQLVETILTTKLKCWEPLVSH